MQVSILFIWTPTYFTHVKTSIRTWASNQHIIFQRHLYDWDIQHLKASPVSDHYLGQYIIYAFILHDSWEAGRYSAELHTFASKCDQVSQKKMCVWPFWSVLVVTAKGPFWKMPNTFPLKLNSDLLSEFTCGQQRTGFNQRGEDVQLVPAEQRYSSCFEAQFGISREGAGGKKSCCVEYFRAFC